MSVENLNRRDFIKCKVTGQNADGCFLKIFGVEERPLVRLFDLFLPSGTVVFVSIVKISDDKRYIKCTLDSIEYSDGQDFAA